MTIAPAYRIHSGNYAAILTLAVQVIDRSGISDLLPPVASTTGIGRPVALAKYNLRAVLICMFEMAWSGTSLSAVNIARRLWFDYSDQCMSLIGLGDLRTDARVEAMVPSADLYDLTAEQLFAADAAFNAEYQRLWKFLDNALADADTTPLPATKRHTRGEIDLARGSDALIAKSVLLKECMNRLIIASIEVHNDRYFPNTQSPLDGILKDWTGDLAIDEHVMTADLGEGTGAASHRTNSGNQQARAFAHIRRTKFGSGVGTTFAVASSRPGRRDVPAITMGIAMHDPSPASIKGLFDVLDGAVRMRPPMSGNRTQNVVVDMGYTGKPGLAQGLLQRAYSPVMKSPATWGNLFDLNKDSTKKNGKSIAHTGKSSGPYLFNGSCVCPGAPRATLNGPRFDVPARKKNESVEASLKDFEPSDVDFDTGVIIEGESDDQYVQRLVNHRLAEEVITRAIMPTHGRPVAATARKRGRPRIGEPEAAKIFRISVQCPARAGLVQCPLFVPGGETEDETATRKRLPVIPEPPTTLEEAPAVCQTQFSTVDMTEEQFSRWQPMMAGTWEHQDLYSTPRSRNEWYHSQLTHQTGGNLKMGTIQFRKNATFSLSVALTAAVTNMKILQSWQEDLTKYRKPPMQGGARIKALREATINTELTKYMRPNMK